jgi:hypothetical protein
MRTISLIAATSLALLGFSGTSFAQMPDTNSSASPPPIITLVPAGTPADSSQNATPDAPPNDADEGAQGRGQGGMRMQQGMMDWRNRMMEWRARMAEQRETATPRGPAAFFQFRRGPSVVTIKCAETESTQACVNAAVTLMQALPEPGGPRGGQPGGQTGGQTGPQTPKP